MLIAPIHCMRIAPPNCMQVPAIMLLPVYSLLPSELQAKIFEPAEGGARKVYLTRPNSLTPPFPPSPPFPPFPPQLR